MLYTAAPGMMAHLKFTGVNEMQFEWRKTDGGVRVAKVGVLDFDLIKVKKRREGLFSTIVLIGRELDRCEVLLPCTTFEEAQSFAEKRFIELIELIQEPRWVTHTTTLSGDQSDAGTER